MPSPDEVARKRLLWDQLLWHTTAESSQFPLAQPKYPANIASDTWRAVRRMPIKARYAGGYMLVVHNNGQTKAVSGWRAWLLLAGLVIGSIAGLILAGFFLVGAALIIGILLLVAIPVGAALSIYGRWRQQRALSASFKKQ